VRNGRTLQVPAHLRDSHYQGSKQFGHEYPHDHPDDWVAQDYLPEKRRYYEPEERDYEAVIRAVRGVETQERKRRRIAK
jgi:putative ATPase